VRRPASAVSMAAGATRRGMLESRTSAHPREDADQRP
jgi:hypothetical protein